MIRTAHQEQIEYGDFQTPLELAHKVCEKLIELGVMPDIIVEPTCGVGNFIDAASNSFKSANKIFAIEINRDYLEQIKAKQKFFNNPKIEIHHGNFFEFDWSSIIGTFNQKILVVGNFPWVTNSQQGNIGSHNLPKKSNFQNHHGLDAITGKSNFDISEWMLIQVVQWLQKREGYLAILCKSSVARKILNYIRSQNLNLAYCANYKIDAKKYFNATVEACLLFCKFDSNSQNYFCDVFTNLETSEYYRIGYRNNILIRDISTFDKLQNLYDKQSKTKWRSGIKHDCTSIMEFRKFDNIFVNGLGEVVDIEERYLFPLVKGSYVAQNKTKSTDRYILVTQRFVGESTECIKDFAPKTWNYLETHAQYLDKRKSKIYQNNPLKYF